jgi:hypothetical protein
VQLIVRKFQTFVEEVVSAAGQDALPPLRKVGVAAIIENPYAEKFIKDLTPLINASEALGSKLAAIAVEALDPYLAQSYGKGALFGVAGEQEHANALLTTAFANPLRQALGGGKAWISSITKCGGPGISVDIPLACKDALYVRSHYDGMSFTFHDAPQPNEIVVIMCLANRGRLNARVGGLAFEEIKGLDGLT